MMRIHEGQLQFRFPVNCAATKYDLWAFYRKRFQSTAGGSKAVDMVCLAGDAAWLIEVKDYSVYPRKKPTDLPDEVAQKVRDTLAGLAAACKNADDPEEKDFARRALDKREWKVVLHLEQPPVQRQLLGPTVERPDVATQLARISHTGGCRAVCASLVVVRACFRGRGAWRAFSGRVGAVRRLAVGRVPGCSCVVEGKGESGRVTPRRRIIVGRRYGTRAGRDARRSWRS